MWYFATSHIYVYMKNLTTVNLQSEIELIKWTSTWPPFHESDVRDYVNLQFTEYMWCLIHKNKLAFVRNNYLHWSFTCNYLSEINYTYQYSFYVINHLTDRQVNFVLGMWRYNTMEHDAGGYNLLCLCNSPFRLYSSCAFLQTNPSLLWPGVTTSWVSYVLLFEIIAVPLV